MDKYSLLKVCITPGEGEKMWDGVYIILGLQRCIPACGSVDLTPKTGVFDVLCNAKPAWTKNRFCTSSKKIMINRQTPTR